MKKRDFVVKILNSLIPYWSYAQYYLDRIEYYDDKKINDLYQQLGDYLKQVTDKQLKNKLEKSFEYMEKIKQNEQLDKKNDEKDIQNLENLIESL